MRYFYQTLLGHFRNLLFTGIAGEKEPWSICRRKRRSNSRPRRRGNRPKRLQRYLEILMAEEENVRRSMNPRLNLEAVLCRMAYPGAPDPDRGGPRPNGGAGEAARGRADGGGSRRFRRGRGASGGKTGQTARPESQAGSAESADSGERCGGPGPPNGTQSLTAIARRFRRRGGDAASPDAEGGPRQSPRRRRRAPYRIDRRRSDHATAIAHTIQRRRNGRRRNPRKGTGRDTRSS